MKNPIGIHLSYWQTKWNDDLLPLIGKAHKAGFDTAEFPLLFPNELDYTALREELDRLDMRASCGTGLGPDTDITHPDPDIRAAGIAHLKACIRGASRLGSPIVGGVTYAPWAVFPQNNREKRRKTCIRSLKEATSFAQDHNVVICMEVLNRFEGYLINTVSEGIAIIEEIGSPYLKLHLDTFHLNIEADQIDAEIRAAGAHLGHFHCVANNRKPPGEGHIPWPAIRQALEDIGYQGYLVAEIFVNPAGEVGQGLFIWRELAADLDWAAKQTAEFLRKAFG